MAEANPSMNRIEIGENIRKRREALGLSQQELGLRLGTNANAVHRYEHGKTELTVDRFCQIADELQTTPALLCPQRYGQQAGSDSAMTGISRMMEGLSLEDQTSILKTMQMLIVGMKVQQQMAG